MPTILEIANSDRNLSSLAKGLKAAQLEEKLNEAGPFTILAPVNFAFSNLTSASFEDLLKKENYNQLIDLLSSHIVKGKKMMRDFKNGQKLTTIHGREVSIIVANDEVIINGSKILSRDRQGSNGVVHSVDTVFK